MVNPERGEVSLTLRGVTVTLAPEMSSWAVVSHAIKTKSLSDLMTQVQGTEPYTMYACLDAFITQKDRAVEIKSAIKTFGDLAKVSAAMVEVVSVLLEDEDDDSPKNGKPEVAKN